MLRGARGSTFDPCTRRGHEGLTRLPSGLVTGAALLLGLLTTGEYVRARGIGYLERGNQIARHLAVLNGHAGNPWQYRILAPYLIEGVMGILRSLGIVHYVAISFIAFRLAQDVLIFRVAYRYYLKLGLSPAASVIGMAMLAWGISYSHFDSDLQFSTFFDVAFYLLAAHCLLCEKFAWLIPISGVAGLNRETSGLIPFLLLPLVTSNRGGAHRRRLWALFGWCLLAYLLVFVTLRLIFGSQELIVPYGHLPGLDLLAYNLLRGVTWYQMALTLSVVPAVALIGFRAWPWQLRGFFWVVVPAWCVVHAVTAVMAETRVFLVPQALIFIPGALVVMTAGERRQGSSGRARPDDKGGTEQGIRGRPTDHRLD